MTIKVFAPAKINLSLHVTGQRADGYHMLDSLVVFADVADRLDITPADEMSLDVSGPFSVGVPADASNLVWQASEICGLTAHIRLEKNLPNAAGIGGGSADAAAVLRAGEQLGCSYKASRITALGADVPVCMTSRPKRMQGIGDQLSDVPSLPSLWMVLVNPRVSVPTPAVFHALETKTNPAMAAQLPSWANFTDFCNWLSDQRNDLETPAITQQPVIREALNALSDAPLARMSGSGATCFGLYASAHLAQASAKRIQTAHPKWWVAAGQVLPE